jgi:hypothetical protein
MDFRLDMSMMFPMRRAVEGTPMAVGAIAAEPHVIWDDRPGRAQGWPGGPGRSVGLAMGGRAGSAVVADGGRLRPAGVLAAGRHDDGDVLAAVALLRRLADWIEAAAAPGVSGNVFRREGEYWTVRYEGSLARLADAKGLRLLARLLADPGREFLAVDLEAGRGRAGRPVPTAERARAGTR